MRRAWLEVKALALPLGTYWAATLGSLGLFTLLLVFIGNGMKKTEDWLILGSLVLSTVAGVAVGQVLALLRIRTWLIASVSVVAWIAYFIAFGFAVSEGVPDEIAIPMVVFLFLFPFFLLCGLWSLRVHMGLLATWGPLVWLTACILGIAEETGKDDAWFAGDKWAIWDVFTAPILLFATAFVLAYLASRELHRLHRWRYAPEGPDLPSTHRKRPEAGARLGCGTLFALAALGAVLTVASAVVAPYLWRSAPTDEGDEPVEQPTQPEPIEQPPPPEEPQGCNEEQDEAEGEGEPQEPLETVREAAEQAARSLLTLILLLALALLAIAVFGPPIRRQLLLTHLRRPLWPVPPTLTVRLSWRLVEIALADAGIERGPGETASALAARAKRALPADMDTLPIEQCAEIADRVVYGLGISPDDTMRARRSAEMAYQALWERIGEARKVGAVYRWL